MQSPKFEGGVWAVVHAGAKRYIGRIGAEGSAEDADAHEMVFEVLREGSFLEISDALELASITLPVRTPQGTAISHSVQVVPVDAALGGTRLYVRPSAVHLFEDMKPKDQERHKNLVEQFVEQLRESEKVSNAADAGILLAGQMPNMGGGRGGFRSS